MPAKAGIRANPSFRFEHSVFGDSILFRISSLVLRISLLHLWLRFPAPLHPFFSNESRDAIFETLPRIGRRPPDKPSSSSNLPCENLQSRKQRRPKQGTAETSYKYIRICLYTYMFVSRSADCHHRIHYQVSSNESRLSKSSDE